MKASIGYIPSRIKTDKKLKAKKTKDLIVPKEYTHSCAVGQTGCGKTTSYIYPNLDKRIEDGDGILVYDYKGKEHAAVKLLAKKHGRLDDVVEIGKDWGQSINLLKYMSEADLENFIDNMLGLAGSNNDYWAKSGTSLSVSILMIIGQYNKFIETVKAHENSYDLLNKCFSESIADEEQDYLKIIPQSKTMQSLLKITVAPETVKEFYVHLKNLIPTIKKGLKLVIYQYDNNLKKKEIQKKYKTIIDELCVFENTVSKYIDSIRAFEHAGTRQASSTLTSITLAINKPIATVGNKKYLNDDQFDLVDALNNNKIVIINTQNISETVLAHASLSFFNELKKRISLNINNSISIFIDEAQRVVSKESDLPIDVLREAKVELFLAFQNNELMIQKLGENKYMSIYKNLSSRFLFKNNERYLSDLKKFEFYNLEKMKNSKPKKSKPMYLDEQELFDVELEYQTKLGLLKKYNFNKSKYKNMIMLNDTHLIGNDQMLFKKSDGTKIIENMPTRIDNDQWNSVFDSVWIAKEIEDNSTPFDPEYTLEDIINRLDKTKDKAWQE